MKDNVISNLGQHFIIGLPDTNPSPDFLNFIKNYNIGGVLFLGKNYSSLEELINTVNKLQEHSPVFPLFTCVDHEGGRVQRFREPFTILPAYRDIAKTKSSKELYEIFILIANELLSCGINFNLSPVADMTDRTDGVIGDRSIGTDLEKVQTALSASIRGFVKGKIICCVKHFPGHGCVEEDSHELLPVSDKSIEELLSYEIVPFKRATRAGVHAIMMSHISFKNIDKLPTSLSPILIQKIIREEFRFTRLVLTDDISMGAITKHFSPEEASTLALEAGNDMIIYSSSALDHLSTLIDNLAKRAESNTDLKNKVTTSQARIEKIKGQIERKKIITEEVLKTLNSSELKKQFRP